MLLLGCDMCDKNDHLGDTDAFLIAHYDNLDPTWLKLFLKEINEQVGRLKQSFKGYAILQVLWHGGTPGQVDWLVKFRHSKRR